MAQKRSNKQFFLGITVAALLPLSFYLVTNELSKNKVKMPRYYHPERVDSISVNGKIKYDTSYHHVSNLTLVNQYGQSVSIDSDLKDKVLVINFFFVNCPSICPRLTNNVGILQKAFAKDPKKEYTFDGQVQFLSITIDPTHDSFPALRTYADAHHANADRWWFLTGDKKQIYDFARNELQLETGPGDGGAEDFIHSQTIVLVDKNRLIRGYYDGLDSGAVWHCADDIVLLLLGKERKK